MIALVHRSLFHLLSQLKMKQKLLISYFILIVMPIVTFSYFTYSGFSESQIEHTTFSAKQAFEQTYSYLSHRFYNIAKVSDIVAYDSITNGILLKNKHQENYGIPNQIEDMNRMSLLLAAYQDSSNIYRIRLYVGDGLVYSNENVNLYNLESIQQKFWYQKLMQYHGKILWCPPLYLDDVGSEPSTRVLTAARVIKNPENYAERIAVLRIDFLENDIMNIFNKANILKNSISYIQNAEGEIMLSTDKEKTGKYQVSQEMITNLSQKMNLQKTKIGKEEVIAGSRRIENSDWYLVTVIPFEEIIAESLQIRNKTLIMTLLIATLAYLFAYYISISISGRINQIIRRMKDVQQGNLVGTYKMTTGKDEIGELAQNYNDMIRKMAVLIEQQYRFGQEVKNAELKALQAQINPHFLYNTLDLINWMAINNGVPEISRIVKNLAQFYKLSLNKGREQVTIREELIHASLYVQIQNIRFANKLKLTINVDELIQQHQILKITLQPLIENAIFHGIQGKEGMEGEMLIQAVIMNGEILLTLTDDGIGIQPESIQAILSGKMEHESTGSGYGIRNIDSRFKLVYGLAYGLTYHSIPGEGTVVEIRIPAILPESINRSG